MRRWLGIGGAVGLGLLAVVSLAAFVYFDRVGEWAVRSEILPELEARLDREVSAERIDVGRGAVVLEDVEVASPGGGEPLAEIRSIKVHYGWLAALMGEPEIGLVAIEGMRVGVVLGGEGEGAFEIARRLTSRAGGRGEKGAGGGDDRLRPERVTIEDAEIALRDEERGVSLSVRDIEAELGAGGDAEAQLGRVDVAGRAGPAGSASDVRVRSELADPLGSMAAEIGEGRIALGAGIALTGIRGELKSGAPGRFDLDLVGSYGGASEALWRAEGWLDPLARTGELSIDAERFTLDRIAHVLEGAPIRSLESTAIGASLRLEVGEDVASFRGDLDVSGLNVAHPMLASEPVNDLGVSVNLRGELDRLTRAFAIEEAEVDFKGVRYGVEGYLWLPGGVDPITGRVRERMRAGGRLAVDPVDCQAVLASIPEALVPKLQGFELSGEFAADLHVDVDLEHPRVSRLGGEVGIHGCRVVGAPSRARASRLSDPFYYRVRLAEEEERRVVVGPENPDFVPYEDVSEHLVNALMTTEDSGFFSHDGFVRSQFRTALVRNLEYGYFRYGASSITMQMVKNVLLDREKTISRKLQELFLTWYVETVLDKERIMEIYVNAIEFGPGIYGIGEAARHYFGKYAGDLNPVESAFFSSILPNPKGRYRQFCRGELESWTESKIERIVDLMHERDRLSSIEHQIAQSTPLFFDRSSVESESRCLRRVSRAIESAPSTTPALEGDQSDGVASR